MKQAICKVCGKVIEGFSQNHADFLMMQHMLIHKDKIVHVDEDDTQLNTKEE